MAINMVDKSTKKLITALDAIAEQRTNKNAYIGKVLGVSRGAVYYWYAGRNKPTPDKLLKIERLSGIDLSDLYIQEVVIHKNKEGITIAKSIKVWVDTLNTEELEALKYISNNATKQKHFVILKNMMQCLIEYDHS